MALSRLNHLLTSLTTFSPPLPQARQIGVIHRAPLPRGDPSTFPAAPNLPTSAFAFENVDASKCQERLEKLQDMQRAAREERERQERAQNWGEDGTSWIQKDGVDGKDELGWSVGWEKATQMEVKRKGRGNFEFEKKLMEGCEGACQENDGEGELADGFLWRHWVVDSEGQTTGIIREAETEKSNVDVSPAAEEEEPRKGMEKQRDSAKPGV